MVYQRSRAYCDRIGVEEPYGISYDPATGLALVQDVIRRGLALAGPHSCAGALLGTFPWNAQAVIAQVMFYHFSKGREMGILIELARLCEAAGATHLNTSSHFPKNTIGRYYERIGLRAVETQWLAPIKNICKGAGK